MNYLSQMDDLKLLAKTEKLARLDHKITAALITHLAEIEKRKLYAILHYDSLFTYCLKHLKFSEREACLRLRCARMSISIPEINQEISSGNLSMSNLSQAQTLFLTLEKEDKPLNLEQKKEILKDLSGKTIKEAEKTLAAIAPKKVRPDKVRAINLEQHEIRFTASQSLLDKLAKAKALLAHQKINSMEEVLSKVLDIALEKLQPKKVKQKDLEFSNYESSRYIPAAVKRLVFHRAGGKCQAVSSITGMRCNSIHALEFAHIKAYAKGGTNDANNLKLLCHSHNRREAIEEFGIAALMPTESRHGCALPFEMPSS